PRLTQVHALLVSLLSFLPDHPLCDHLVTVVFAFASSLTVPISRDHEDLHLAASYTCSSSPPTAPTTCPTTPRVLACDACAPSMPRYQVSLLRSSGTSTRSPARQSYLLLLASATRHAVRLGRLASSASILAVAGLPIPFIIPSHLLLSPAALGATIEIGHRRCSAHSSAVQGMLHSSNVVLLHSLLTPLLQFPDAFGAEDERLFRNLVPGLTHWFYPVVFDPLGLKSKMLDCLPYVVDGVLMGLQQQQAEQ
ncbi:hypothetical protein ACJX0J_015977, partial [Zea mays]